MRINKTAFILVFPFIAEFFVGCCDCVESHNFSYTHCDLSVENLDNRGPEAVVTAADTLDAAGYGVRVVIARNDKLCEAGENSAPFPTSIFFPAASAFKCECPPERVYNPRDTITSFGIFTVNDFDADHPAGSDVTALFKVFDSGHFTSVELFSRRLSLPVENELSDTVGMDALLMSLPAAHTFQKFEVRMLLSDGRYMEIATPEIFLR